MFSSLGDTLNLVKQTFVIVKRNPAIIKPTMKELAWALLFYVLVVIGVIGYLVAVFTVGADSTVVFTVLGTDYAFSPIEFSNILNAILVVFGILLIFGFPFIKTYYRAIQTWMVYESFTGKGGTYAAGKARAKKNMGDIVVLTILDIIFTYLANRLKQGSGQKGIFGIILSIIMFFIGKLIEEAWDLIGHYLLPAVIIEEKNVQQAIPELKNMKNNIPGALVGVFGLDFAADLARGLLIGILFVLSIGAVLIAIFLKAWWIAAVFIIMYVGVYVLASVFMDMLKTVYFTLFYMSVNHPAEILPEFRKEVTGYLTYKNNVESTAVSSTPVRDASPSIAEPKDSPAEVEDKVSKLLPFVQQYRAQGMSDAEIVKFLVEYNWPEPIVRKALEKR